MIEAFGKTALGQLLHDLAFTDIAAATLAEKHRLSVARIGQLRRQKEIAELRRKVKLDRKRKQKTRASA